MRQQDREPGIRVDVRGSTGLHQARSRRLVRPWRHVRGAGAGDGRTLSGGQAHRGMLSARATSRTVPVRARSRRRGPLPAAVLHRTAAARGAHAGAAIDAQTRDARPVRAAGAAVRPAADAACARRDRAGVPAALSGAAAGGRRPLGTAIRARCGDARTVQPVPRSVAGPRARRGARASVLPAVLLGDRAAGGERGYGADVPAALPAVVQGRCATRRARGYRRPVSGSADARRRAGQAAGRRRRGCGWNRRRCVGHRRAGTVTAEKSEGLCLRRATDVFRLWWDYGVASPPPARGVSVTW